MKWLCVLSAALFCACDGSTVASANVAITMVPCALLWLTLNLEKG